MIEKIEDTPLWEKLKNNTLGDSTNLFILVNTKVKLSMSQGYCNLPPIGDQDLEDISEDLSEDSSYNKDDYKLVSKYLINGTLAQNSKPFLCINLKYEII